MGCSLIMVAGSVATRHLCREQMRKDAAQGLPRKQGHAGGMPALQGLHGAALARAAGTKQRGRVKNLTPTCSGARGRSRMTRARSAMSGCSASSSGAWTPPRATARRAAPARPAPARRSPRRRTGESVCSVQPGARWPPGRAAHSASAAERQSWHRTLMPACHAEGIIAPLPCSRDCNQIC